MNYGVKPIVCDYAVFVIGTKDIVCICNIKRNAELIADILNVDNTNSCAYAYDHYPYAKYRVIKEESENI